MSASVAAARRLDVQHVELGVAAARQALAVPDEDRVRVAASADRHEHPLARPRVGIRRVEMRRRDLGELVQDERAQGGEVLDREEARQRLLDAIRGIDETARDALAQRCRAEVDELDLVGFVQEPIRERLADLDSGERADAVAEALEVLDVDGRPDVDAVREQDGDIVVALGPRRLRRVRVRQLVDDRDARTALDQPRDIGLGLGAAARSVAHHGRGLEAARALLGRDAPVRLEIADHDVGALLGGEARVPQHLVGLAHAGGRAEVDAQESACNLERSRHLPSLGSATARGATALGALQTFARILWRGFTRALYGRAVTMCGIMGGMPQRHLVRATRWSS